MLWPLVSDSTRHDAWLAAYVHQSSLAGCSSLPPILPPPARLLVGPVVRGSLLQRAALPPCRTQVSVGLLLSRSGLMSFTPIARTEACRTSPYEFLPSFSGSLQGSCWWTPLRYSSAVDKARICDV